MSSHHYNPERRVWKGISHRKGTSGHGGTRINQLRDDEHQRSHDPRHERPEVEDSQVKTSET